VKCVIISRMAPYDQWGFHQKLESQDEDAFLSMANRLGRRSEEIKVNLTALFSITAVKMLPFRGYYTTTLASTKLYGRIFVKDKIAQDPSNI